MRIILYMLKADPVIHNSNGDVFACCNFRFLEMFLYSKLLLPTLLPPEPLCDLALLIIELYTSNANLVMTYGKGKTSGLNLLLTCHEDENISWRLPQMDWHGLLDGCLHIILLDSLAVQHVNWKSSSWDLEDGYSTKEVGKFIRI